MQNLSTIENSSFLLAKTKQPSNSEIPRSQNLHQANILNMLIKRHRFRKEAERSAHIIIFDSQNFIIQPEINQ